LAERLECYNVRVDPLTVDGAKMVQAFGNLRFDEEMALAGYDLEDYKPPRDLKSTPRKRKRPAPVEDDEEAPAESGPPTPKGGGKSGGDGKGRKSRGAKKAASQGPTRRRTRRGRTNQDTTAEGDDNA
jgi:hypothetical protein